MPQPLVIPAEFKDPTTNQLIDKAVEIIACGHIMDAGAYLNKTLYVGKDVCPCPGCLNKDLKIKYLPELQARLDQFKLDNAEALQEYAAAQAAETKKPEPSTLSKFSGLKLKIS